MKNNKISTKNLILDTARDLFNIHGAATVTTNHIAKACGISPGNLYYHFRNREHIFLESLRQMIVLFDEIFLPSPDIERIINEDIFSKTCTVMFQYRYIYSDLSFLITDDTFRKTYLSIKKKRLSDFKDIIVLLSDRGILKNIPESKELKILITIIWTYIEGIVTSLKTSGKKVTESTIRKSLQDIIVFLKPYLIH